MVVKKPLPESSANIEFVGICQCDAFLFTDSFIGAITGLFFSVQGHASVKVHLEELQPVSEILDFSRSFLCCWQYFNL